MLEADDTPNSIDHGSFIPGTIVAERYRVVGLLGKGGMGEVYRADDLKLGQTVALKFLPDEWAGDPQRRERFHHEVRMARQVAHPNLCRVYDIDEVDGAAFLSMEFIDGEDLSSLLRRIGRVPRNKAIELARQICAGLAAAHGQGILHRDLKPANLMIDGRGRVRITDFGLAALADDLVGAAARAGTPSYMAPEQLAGKEFTVRSEVYTLGLVLYEVFTGRRAFVADKIEEYARLHAESPPKPPSEIVPYIDPVIERVILQCLEKNPAARPNSPLEVAAALPGGDPLAAAVAAGEIPSPELVAASTPSEVMPAAVNVACLLLILCGMAALPFVHDSVKLHAFAPLDKSPAVLVDHAREIIDTLGYEDRPADWARGFRVDADYLNYLEQRDDSPNRWNKLAAGRPAGIYFWYRQSPRALVPNNLSAGVSFTDPPPLVPGMIGLRVDPQGRLISFRATPASSDPGRTGPLPDWTMLFEQAGLDLKRFRQANAHFIPPVFCDRRVSWTGTSTENPDATLRVDAGVCGGRLVHFEVRLEAAGAAPAPHMTPSRAGLLINIGLLIVSLAGAAVLARRSLAQGRGDSRGALRVSVLVGVTLMAAWVLQANHVADAVEELRLLAAAAGRSLLAAGVCWLLYISLEPSVRQRRPEVLISWSRLLDNRFRDPVIGRDILIGGLFGVVGVLLSAMLYFAPALLDAPPPRPVAVSNLAFLGLRYNTALLFNILTMSVLGPIAVLLFMLLLLVLFRSRLMARLGLFVVMTGVSTLLTFQPGGNIYIHLAAYAMLAAALIFVLLRFGLLAVMTGGFYLLLLDSFPITARSEMWYADSSNFALAIAAGLAFFGFWSIMRERGKSRRVAMSDLTHS